MNFLYFQNIIPPIPLSLKDIGAYHMVERTEEGYSVVSEKKEWRKASEWFGNTFHTSPGSPVYVYSAVFAPTDIETDVIYKWQYFDEIKELWVVASEIPTPVVGGRDEGYRGFSVKENVFPGKWRVDVVTPRGQLIGRIKFDIVYSKRPGILQTEFK